MRKVDTINDLFLPDKYSKFITGFLDKAHQIPSFNKITKFILFGSCARGTYGPKSDIDIMVLGNGIGDDTLFELYDCTWWPELEEENRIVNSDIMVNDQNYFDERSNIIGSLQWRVVLDGVIINELL